MNHPSGNMASTLRRLLILLALPLSFLLSAFAMPTPGRQERDSVPEEETGLNGDSVSMPTLDLIMEVDTSHTSTRTSPRKISITPVDNDRNRPEQPRLHYYDKHGERLAEPVLFLVEEKDTVVSPKSPYPLFNGIQIGVDFLEAIEMAFGQSHASVGVNAAISLHNWFFPILELGVGFADNKPDDGNFHYNAKASPFVKLGLNYNFLYKSKPDYQAYLGLRAGFSSTRYSIEDITISNDYWETTQHLTIPDQKAHIWFGEVVAGIKVKIAGPFSLGWKGRYRFKFSATEGSASTPWFFPGYGASSPFSADITAYLTF